MKFFICFLILLLTHLIKSQTIEGVVIDSKKRAIYGASLHWQGTALGTLSNVYGEFKLVRPNQKNLILIIRHSDYLPDTVYIQQNENKEFPDLTIQLKSTKILSEVIINGKKNDKYISKINPINTEVITKNELKKAACCDLAGCFDTQGSVQPTTTNIVTNSKELRILGLSGVYNQVLIDGLPLIQGTSYTYGISSIPGTLVENIFVSKGANSVLQGYESIAGQINVELKEPEDNHRLLLNLYGNSFRETQYNLNLCQKFKKWRTIFAIHTTQPADEFDRDIDGFLDLPLTSRYSVYNKWIYGNENKWGWYAKVGLRYVHENRIGGQRNYDSNIDIENSNFYYQILSYSQPEVYSKISYRLNNQHNFVLLTSGFFHNQNSFFGKINFKANQQNAYSNFQHEFNWNEKHNIKSGLSYRYVELNETITFTDDDINLERSYNGNYLKSERIPGFFIENTFNWKEGDLILISGLRGDMHNKFGLKITPRALIKYCFLPNTTARISFGTGWRTINLFTENVNLLASSRDLIIDTNLEPEQAVNFGANLTQKLGPENFKVQLTMDYYLTQFSNQLFPDYYSQQGKAIIGNFFGKSISSSFQAEIGIEIIERIGIRTIYNYLDVYRVQNNLKNYLPFNPKHRLTSTLSFKPLNNKWHLDFNAHYYGIQRLASTLSNPILYQFPEYSNSFITLNGQFTLNVKFIEIYLGCENLSDFRQLRPIVSWQDPFSPFFDTSNVWGPTRGREIYLGIRFFLK